MPRSNNYSDELCKLSNVKGQHLRLSEVRDVKKNMVEFINGRFAIMFGLLY